MYILNCYIKWERPRGAFKLKYHPLVFLYLYLHTAKNEKNLVLSHLVHNFPPNSGGILFHQVKIEPTTCHVYIKHSILCTSSIFLFWCCVAGHPTASTWATGAPPTPSEWPTRSNSRGGLLHSGSLINVKLIHCYDC